jgi:hypothetical protein
VFHYYICKNTCFLHSQNKINIIIAPLDWGIGHCARCLPIIKYLQLNNVNVYIAGNAQQIDFFKNENIEANYLFLKGYNIAYGTTEFSTNLKLLFQIPSTWRYMYLENTQLKQWHAIYNFNAVISDNRYGFYLNNIPSICITHQLHIPTSLFNSIANKINYLLLKKFSTIWVPDFENNYLAGNLSKPLPNLNIQYLGGLSRLDKLNVAAIPNSVLIILSGPEPQRSIFEKILIAQFANTIYNVNIIGSNTCNKTAAINIVKHAILPTKQVQQYMATAQYQFSRSGYTTILDLAKCERKAILVPTPAQPEQVYLAAYLSETNRHIARYQNHLDVHDAIREFNNHTATTMPNLNWQQYKTIIDKLLIGFN